ncbi:unnamed protein product [Sphagnum troendelagicum]|uniref:Secreted protein n=1 Tax=Sphagnum troendelagicum TaxID=128251 RepID=A0ABP0TYZ5_9BRYO
MRMMRKLVRSNDVVADRFLLLLSLGLQLHALVSLLRLVDAGGGVSSLSLSGSINVSQTLVSPHDVFKLGFYSLQQSNTNSCCVLARNLVLAGSTYYASVDGQSRCAPKQLRVLAAFGKWGSSSLSLRAERSSRLAILQY